MDMRTREPERMEQIDQTQRPVRGVVDADPSTPGSSLLSGWRGPLVGGLLAVILVFAVLDIGRLLFPQHAPGTTRPIVINVQNGGDTSTTNVSTVLAVSPQPLHLGCGQTATITLTNTASNGIHWNIDTQPDGITLSANSPRGGGLGPGEHVALQVISLNKSSNATLRFVDDRGGALDLSVSVQC